MARFDMSGLDGIIRDMQAMGQDTGPVADAMLLTGAEQVAEAWRRSAEEHELRDTGDMIASIGYPRKPSGVGSAKSIDIYPQGVDRKGVRNAEKAFILHYGTSKRPGTRWVDDADAYCEGTVVPAMEQIWNEFIETGRVPSSASGRGVGGGISVQRGK